MNDVQKQYFCMVACTRLIDTVVELYTVKKYYVLVLLSIDTALILECVPSKFGTEVGAKE